MPDATGRCYQATATGGDYMPAATGGDHIPAGSTSEFDRGFKAGFESAKFLIKADADK